MAAASDSVVTVFGGTGFLGCRIVRHLRLHGFCVRVASRHPDRGHALFGPDDPQLRSVKADVHDERSVADALADAYGVVNAVSLYVEQGWETFHSVHVESAQRVAAQAQRAGVKRLVHVSGIGADPRSHSLYIRKRGEGELAVRVAFADAILIRPAVMFGPDDAFLTTILKLLDRPDAIAASLCGRCWAGDRKGAATAADAPDYVRVWWPSRLLLRGIS
jgi:NADH dehydrogenase